MRLEIFAYIRYNSNINLILVAGKTDDSQLALAILMAFSGTGNSIERPVI